MFTVIPAQPEMRERIIVRDPSMDAKTLAAYFRSYGEVETVTVIPVGRRKAHRYYVVTATPRVPMAARRELGCEHEDTSTPVGPGRHRTTGPGVKQGIAPTWMKDLASAQRAANHLHTQR